MLWNRLAAGKAGRWGSGVLILALMISLPILMLALSWLQPQWDVWSHLTSTVLVDYVSNSLLLALGTGMGSLFIGTACAWCVVRYQFPFRQFLQWALLLPMAIPGYIIAYTYTGILDFSGPVQRFVRHAFSLQYGQYYFPDIQSLPGAILMLSLVLFPYVYLLGMGAFKAQSTSLYFASRGMGLSHWQYFQKVALPLARPALFTGAALTMMEAFADFGTVQYFGVPTFTTGIFRVWFGMNSPMAAAQLASCLCLFVLMLLVWEQLSRRKQRFYQSGQKSQPLPPVELGKVRGSALALLVALPFLLGFVIPVWQLISWSVQTFGHMFNQDFIVLLWNSFKLAILAAVVVSLVALILGYGKRVSNHLTISAVTELSGLGYALPGIVIAIGVMIPFAWLDKLLNQFLNPLFDTRLGLVFSGTLFALIFAYVVRFLTVAKHSVDAGLERIRPSMDEAARNLGFHPNQVLQKIHIPLLKGSVLSAILLVFVDVMKELPATLILRPFNFNTLAVKTYELASDERLADAALPAISIVVTGLIPIIFLAYSIDKQKGS